MQYYVVKNLDTNLYFRGKGVNKWGKCFNQASIYRIRKQAEETAAWEKKERGANAKVVTIQIIECEE